MPRAADLQQSRPRQVSGPAPDAPRVSAPEVEHLLRRAGFGGRPDELAFYGDVTLAQAVDELIDYDTVPDTVDDNIRKSALNFI
jgi:hypothetical protein